jgi:hypothetical protein
MERAIIEKTILDMLIRAKLARMPGCEGIKAMPVTWHSPHQARCNWSVPGWLGNGGAVPPCAERMAHYLAFLQSQFDIPDEGPRGPKKAAAD